MAEGWEPKPTEAQIASKMGNCVIKNIGPFTTATTVTLTSTANWPRFFAFGTNSHIMNETMIVGDPVVADLFNGTSGESLNPTKVANNAMSITVKAYGQVTIISNNDFTVS